MKLFYVIVLGLMVLISACAQQPQPVQPQPVPVAPAPQPVVQPEPGVVIGGEDIFEEEFFEEVFASTEDIRMLGQGVFDPDELTINVGNSVTWINAGDKSSVVIIFKDGRSYVNSKTLRPGDVYEHEFTEAGTYDYWQNIAFSGTSSKIIVE